MNTRRHKSCIALGPMNDTIKHMVKLLILIVTIVIVSGCASVSEVTNDLIDSIIGEKEDQEHPAGYGEAERISVGSPVSSETVLRSDPFIDSADTSDHDFSRIDAVARSVPESEEQSVASLSAYFRYKAENEMELARAIFVWLTDNIAYDAESFFRGGGSVYQPESVLRSRKAVCEGYARLYEAIAAESGLLVEVVTGYAKGYGHVQGSPINQSNHAWNRVLVEDEWLLVDATWGAGHLDGRAFRPRFNPFFFAPQPEALIFSHYPSDPDRQHLLSPVSTREFSAFPKISEELFTFGLDPRLPLRALRAGEPYTPPRAFSGDQLGDVQIKAVEIPWQGELEAGREYRLEIEIKPPLPAAVINGREWTFMEYEEAIASAVVTPERGELGIAVQPSAADDRYTYVIMWEVE